MLAAIPGASEEKDGDERSHDQRLWICKTIKHPQVHRRYRLRYEHVGANSSLIMLSLLQPGYNHHTGHVFWPVHVVDWTTAGLIRSQVPNAPKSGFLSRVAWCLTSGSKVIDVCSTVSTGKPQFQFDEMHVSQYLTTLLELWVRGLNSWACNWYLMCLCSVADRWKSSLCCLCFWTSLILGVDPFELLPNRCISAKMSRLWRYICNTKKKCLKKHGCLKFKRAYKEDVWYSKI